MSIATVLLLWGCTKDAEPELTEKVVVEAFLFEGEPVDHIYLTKMVPFGGKDTTPEPINDAVVRINWKGDIYALEPNGGDSGYYQYTGTDLQVVEGDQYEIEVDYFDQTASGSTLVPSEPQDFSISKDTMEIPEFDLGSIFDTADVTNLFDTIRLSWRAEPNAYFYVVIQNIEENLEQILPDFIAGELVDFFIFSTPFQGNSYLINELDLTHYGDHQYNVYKINQEYVDLFTSLNQDSRTLNEPNSNILNGLGVFSAFNAKTGTFHVKKP